MNLIIKIFIFVMLCNHTQHDKIFTFKNIVAPPVNFSPLEFGYKAHRTGATFFVMVKYGNKKLKQRQCIQCGEFYTPLASNSPKTCSDACNKLRRHTVRASYKGGSGAGLCAVCGKQFDKNRPNHLYCSLECKNSTIFKRYNNFSIFDRDAFRCVYCGKSSIEDGIKLQADHIIPRKVGGPDCIENMVTACEQCNREKSDTLININNLKRLKEVVINRNSLLSKQQITFIEKEIMMISKHRKSLKI